MHAWFSRLVLVTGVLLAAALHSAPLLAENAWQTRLASGFYFSQGDYRSVPTADGKPVTRIAVLPFNVRLRKFPWTLKLGIPWVGIDGPGNVVEESVAGSPSRTAGPDRKAKGVGDTTLDATYSFPTSADGHWYTDLTAKVKLPTANENQGLGTGASDYELRLDFARSLGRWTGFAHLGYKRRGDTSETAFVNSPNAGIGVQTMLNRRLSGGISWDVRGAAFRGNPPARELMLFSQYALEKDWKLQTYVTGGLSDSAADQAIGGQISYQF